MEKLQIPRFLLGGASRDAGTFVVGIGIVMELRRRGMSVSCAVIGPNLLQAMVFRRLCGRYVRCLDSRLLSSSQNLMGLHRAGVGADIVMVLGSSGLYDGIHDEFFKLSDANFASLAQSPAALVVDAHKFGPSVAALVKGYQGFSEGFNLLGAILNQVELGNNFDRKCEVLGDAFQTVGLSEPIGIIPSMESLPLLPPRTISQQLNLTSLPHQFFVSVSRLVNEHV